MHTVYQESLLTVCGIFISRVQEPEIVRMERSVGKVRKEKADLLAERRRQDIMDMDKDCAQPEGLPLCPVCQNFSF